MEKIIEQLKAARLKKKLSQKALGEKVGIPQSHISKIEQGLVDLQMSSLIQIARSLELEVLLISREWVTAVTAIQIPGKKQTPAYSLEEEDANE